MLGVSDTGENINPFPAQRFVPLMFSNFVSRLSGGLTFLFHGFCGPSCVFVFYLGSRMMKKHNCAIVFVEFTVE